MKVFVDAKHHSTNRTGAFVSGLEFKQGDVLKIRCDPQDFWNISKTDNNKPEPANANGILGQPVQLRSGQSFYAGSLVGSFDNGKTFIPIGLNADITVVQTREQDDFPRFHLYCADYIDEGNSGHIDVTVEKVAP